MYGINESILIERRQEDVFAFVSDFNNDHFWRAALVSMLQAPPAPMQEGANTHEILHFMGREIDVRRKVTRIIHGEQLTLESLDSAYPLSEKRIAQRVLGRGNERTCFIFSLHVELTGMFTLASPLVTAVFRRQAQGDLFRLKHHLEKQAVRR